jgi:aminomethyltransferase
LKQERAVRHDYEIVDEGAVIGIVTSGTMSPSMNKGIGLGYVTINANALIAIFTFVFVK